MQKGSGSGNHPDPKVKASWLVDKPSPVMLSVRQREMARRKKAYQDILDKRAK